MSRWRPTAHRHTITEPSCSNSSTAAARPCWFVNGVVVGFLFTPLSNLQDLDRALTLPVVPRGVRMQALVQRAILREVGGDPEGARADYEAAAALGSAFARAQSVRLNPFARLCNQMMSQMLLQCQPPAGCDAPAPP